ncbi:hypothetical protein SAMN04488057_11689 [Cyclobacterium lianum]|uniref:Uncharacterized protein n=1 Tax=Cyclobacterium lianum TaxID=388280 RepID=A0A1M7QDI3_9BACT|nr:hypothetical protein SAMN04488057_11689 [Cyclobacterium lianum]
MAIGEYSLKNSMFGREINFPCKLLVSIRIENRYSRRVGKSYIEDVVRPFAILKQTAQQNGDGGNY